MLLCQKVYMKSEQLDKFLNVFNTELPESVLDKVKVLFLDGDSENWSVDNIDYCFEGGEVECPFYKGFFYLPGFSRYVINRKGELLIVKTGRLKTWIKTFGKVLRNVKGGYMVSHGVYDKGRVKRSIGRHRALCLTFKHPGIVVHKLTVNHKDGIPGNDDLDNLEFCSYSENTKHAYDNNLYPNKTTYVDVLNWITGESLSFPTIVKCSERIGIPINTTYSRISRSNSVRYPDGWRIKRKNDVWEELKNSIRESITDISVICRNIFDNTVMIFSTIGSASRETDIGIGTIQSQIELEPNTPIYGWNFRKLDKFEGWPVYTDKHLKIFKDYPKAPGDGIEVYDCNTNETMFFTSPEVASKYFNISPITIGKLARYNRTRQKRFCFKLFKIR